MNTEKTIETKQMTIISIVELKHFIKTNIIKQIREDPRANGDVDDSFLLSECQ